MGAGASVPIDGELAKVLSASDGDLAAAAEKVNREIVRVVPKTRSGRFDPERGERAAVLQVVERANLLAQHGYAVSWAYYNKPEDGAQCLEGHFLCGFSGDNCLRGGVHRLALLCHYVFT